MSRILVFDSGVGAIPIAEAIQQHVPDGEIIILADNAFFPYGDKADDLLIERIRKVITAANRRFQPDIIVLACNTASTIALDVVRSDVTVPVVGVVPAIKPAAELTKTGVIGVLATPATIRRDYTHDLIQQFAPDCQVILTGSTELVGLAEQWAYTGQLDETKLEQILKPMIMAEQSQQMDTMVLGCTHFPLLDQQVKKLLPAVAVIDSSIAIGKQVQRLLSDAGNTGSRGEDLNSSKNQFMLTEQLAMAIYPTSQMAGYQISAFNLED